jgi:two-component system sensor histidine kinase AtoS
MDIRLLSILITALANIILASYVLFKSPKRIINISFSLFVYSVGLWSLALFLIGIGSRGGSYETAVFAGYFSWFAGAMMACNFLLFTYVFPQFRDEFPPQKNLLLIYIPGLVMGASASLTRFVMEGIMLMPLQDIYRPVRGKGFYPFSAYCIFYVVLGLYLLARKYFKYPGQFERVQIKYMFWGSLISISGVVMLTLILPAVGVSRYSTPLTPLVTMVSVIATSYAIVRHRLMDLGVVFRNALIYCGIALMMSVFLIGGVFLLDPLSNISRVSLFLFTAILAAVLVHPTRLLVEFLVDHFYFRGRYDYQTALSEFSISMTQILNLEDLQNRIVKEMVSILKVRSAALLLLDPEEDAYSIRCSIPPGLCDTTPDFLADNPIVEKVKQERLLIAKDELRRLLSRTEYRPLEVEFEKVDSEVIIPLFYRDELGGLLSLGEKHSADIFSREDLNLLATLGNQVAIALENALLHHKVTLLMNHNESILKHMSSGLVATDRRQTISTCNDKAREILRLPQEGVLGEEIAMLPPPLQEMLSDTLNEKTTYSNHEVEILSDRNAVAYLNAATSLLKDESDRITGALLLFNDLTEIKLLESEMWRADKLASLGTLAAGMAHEIKNPLVSIKTFAQLLPKSYEDKDFRDTFSTIAIEEVERINSIVEKLLEFARPTAPMFEPVDVITTIEEVLLLLTPEFTKHEINVAKHFEAASALIIGDKGQLKQAMLNLCLNGMQAMQDLDHAGSNDLSITVGFRKSRQGRADGSAVDEITQMFYSTEMFASAEDGETLLIKVRDNGRGIGRKELARIFDPFFTTKEKGLGLGLAVVHGIVKEHSGNISVESDENAGTEFTISLPVRQLFAKEKV